jgi:hypothetical protein
MTFGRDLAAIGRGKNKCRGSWGAHDADTDRGSDLADARTSAKALLVWNWSYSSAGVSASGTFTTNDAPDAAGFYQIVGITDTDNGKNRQF